MTFNPDDFAPKKPGFNPDEFLPSGKSGFNPDEFLPKEEGFKPEGFLPVTQNDFKSSISEIVQATVGAIKEQLSPILNVPPVAGAGAARGATLGYIDPTKAQAVQGLDVDPLTRQRAEVAGEFAGAAAPITGIAKGVGTGARMSQAVVRMTPWLRGVAEAGAVGGIYGAAKKPEHETLAQRAENARDDAALFMAFAGIGEVVSKVAEAVKSANWYRKLTIPERAVALSEYPNLDLPDAEMMEVFKSSPEGVQKVLADRNPKMRRILQTGSSAEPVSPSARLVEEPLFPVEAKAPEAAPAPAKVITGSPEREVMLNAQIETAKAGLVERPTAPVQGWKSEPVQGGGTSLESPSGYRVFVPEGQDPTKAAAIREIEKAEYGESQIPTETTPIETPLFETPKTEFDIEKEIDKYPKLGSDLRDRADAIMDNPDNVGMSRKEALEIAVSDLRQRISEGGDKYESAAFKKFDKSLSKIEQRISESYAQKTGAQVEGGGQEIKPPEGQGSGLHLRDLAENGVEAAKGEVAPQDEPIAPAPAEPPPTPPAEKPAAMSDDEWIAKFRKDLASAKPEVGLQNMMYSEERAKRFAAATNAYALAGGGKAGAIAALGQLKGALEKRAFESLTKTINQEGVDRLTDIIFKSPNLKTMGDRLSAFQGFERIIQGKLPQEGQIAKLQRVFGKELTDEIIKKQPMLRKAYDLGLQVVNMPRSLMASMDLSAPFRQGIFFVSRPEFWGRAWPDMIKSLKSEADFKALQEAIENDPDYPMLKEKGLDLTGMSTVAGEREEDFAVPIIERALNLGGYNVNLPGRLIRASGRAYVGFLNKLRLDVAKALLKSAENSGFKPTEDLVEKIVKYVNAGTGRGGLGPLQGAATALNTVLFSPRLMASRLNLMTKVLQPSFYAKNNAFIRQQYWRDALSFLALGSTVMGVAKMAGAEVGLDPRSSDFGKIKIGNTRLDVWGGFQQYARMLGQLVAGEYVSSITGKVMTLGEGYKPMTRRDILARQVESKLSPTASFVNAMLKGQDWEGQPISVRKEIADRMVPLAMKDLATVAKDNPELLPISALGLLGFGVQTYGGEKPVDYKKMAQGMSFQDLAKTLEITEDPKVRTQLFQAAIKKFPAAIRKAEDKEEVKNIRAKMVENYRAKK